MTIIEGLSTLVQNVHSIQGISQFANGCYCSLRALDAAATVFSLSRIKNYLPAYELKHEVTFINGISILHRILLLILNIDRPKNLQGYAELFERMGVGCFFLVKNYLPVSKIYQETIADAFIGVSCLINAYCNRDGEKTIYNGTKDSINKLLTELMNLEVAVEHSRDLQKIQQILSDKTEMDIFCAELNEKNKMLEDIKDKEVFAQKIKELESLKKQVCTENVRIQTEKNSLERQRNNRKDIASQSELDNIEFQLKALNIRDDLLKENSDINRKNNFDMNQKIQETISRLKKSESPETKRDCHATLKLLKFFKDLGSLDEELRSLENLRDISYNIGKKAKIDKLKEAFFDNQKITNEHLISLKGLMRENARSMLKKTDVTSEQVEEEVKSEFYDAFDVLLLENIAITLVTCNQLIQCIDSSKILQRDLFIPISSAIESMSQILDILEEKVVAQHAECNEDCKEFIKQARYYFIAVTGIFNYKEEDDISNQLTKVVSMQEDVQAALSALRRAFQRERDKLLKKLKTAEDILTKPNDWDSLRQRYSRPFAKMLFGLFILGVRFLFKLRGEVESGLNGDRCLDIFIMSGLALSEISPLLNHNKDLRSRVIVIPGINIQAGENVVHACISKVTSFFNECKKSFLNFFYKMGDR